MNPIVRNIIAVIAGFLVGGIVNSGLVNLGPMVIKLPPAVDMTSVEGLKDGMSQLQARHFIFPFLAHSLGTFVGAMVTALLAARRKKTLAYLIGILFFIGGAINVAMLDAPMWFNTVDLLLAYMPMAYLGALVAIPSKNHQHKTM
jgi:hypothetical protein